MSEPQQIGEGLCNRCLIQVNVSTNIVARWKGGNVEVYHNTVTHVPSLAKWAASMLYNNNAVISTNDMMDTFRPVSTWHGDPVCRVHLFLLVKKETQGMLYS